MKLLHVPFIQLPNQSLLKQYSAVLDNTSRYPIGFANWSAFGYKPNVRFAIAHNGEAIFIKFYVQENEFRAQADTDQQPVYQDSCVEFFVKAPDELSYCNFEFNPHGVCLAARGNNRNERVFFSPQEMKTIERLSDIKSTTEGDVWWNLCVAIPIRLIGIFDTDKLPIRMQANFYKCGDALRQPHYASWQIIETSKPDFHRPDFFGQIELQPFGNDV